MEIRQGKIEDSAGIAKVEVDSYRTTYAGIYPQVYLDRFTYEEQERGWRDLFSSGMDDVLYVAETGAGEIVGYALGRSGSTGIPSYDSELVALHVHRSYQGRGIGRQLLRATAEQLKLRGCTALMLWVLEGNPSRSFFERMGGQLLDEIEDTMDVPEVAYGWAAIESLCG
jgi:ribosomal protein S18 acetylase RimI-like enzyme